MRLPRPAPRRACPRSQYRPDRAWSQAPRAPIGVRPLAGV